MWRTTFIAAAILLMTALPSFGHGMPAHDGISGAAVDNAIGAPIDHAEIARISAAFCPDTGCSDNQVTTCADLTASHCHTGFFPPETGHLVSSGHIGFSLFTTPDAQLRGISLTAETPPPRI
ncbi:hypothetical protein [Nisaea nitritireducens]|uniref:hypothetical protein n=1 Tax=Nisaea nitritireducens TaxID=568392 RepID=UPI001868575A|nr:hypothetical protein [Nisaea nitritireducens]